MAGPDELDSFVRKFRTLWKSGRNAKLFVETEAGHAFVNLQVGLGQAQPQQPVWHGGRGGSPSKQRRLERRAEERREVAAAAAEVEKVEKAKIAEKASEAEAENVSETQNKVTDSPIPQVDGIADDEAHFVIQVDAHEKCTNDDVIESIEVNFSGHLDDKKVEKTDPVRNIRFREANKNLKEVQNEYRVTIKDDDLAVEILERWNTPYEFDDLAFDNAVYDEIKIKIKNVRRAL
jgi:hypothetical protein